MSFLNCEIRDEYRSLVTDVVKDFFIPLLNEAVIYKRAVGFFSSTALVQISRGIIGLARNGGKIQLIASPYLSDDDIQAMQKGYKEREDIIRNAIIRHLTEPENYEEQKRLNLLANLIMDEILDIKIAFTKEKSRTGMYHEKMGIMEDKDGNKVAFSGSMNESANAMYVNYEAIDVFCSWKDNREADRVNAKESVFFSIWCNTEPNIDIVDFPNLKQEIIDKYRKSKVDYMDDDLDENSINLAEHKICERYGAIIPEYIKLHDYQISAINEWKKNNFKGIFDMATGTGKTFAGLGAVARLSEHLDGKLAVIIVCPYQHLVEQWIEDIVKFNISPIIGYSASSQKDWEKRLENAVRDQKLGIRNKCFFCFVSTNATFASEYVQSQISKIKSNSLLVVDEAHNFGSENLSRLLSEKFDYRLALSATLERHNDPEGTDKLYNYFGIKCIEYSLERAINEGKLTKYKYYPVLVYLSESELNAFADLTREIGKCMLKTRGGKIKLSEKGKKLALKRARLVAAAESKIETLKERIFPFKNDNHLLVYCGAAKMLDYDKDFTCTDSEDLRQIDVVTDLLGNELNMKVSQFTSKENVLERGKLKQEFSDGENLQALIAIKCLDEGVNIPSIKTAFILASTTNPKEYIQRRGRVLRLAKGKQFAQIFDFVTLPRPLDEVSSLTLEQMNKEILLVKNELCRSYEFARLAVNFIEANEILDNIREAYSIDDELYTLEEDYLYE